MVLVEDECHMSKRRVLPSECIIHHHLFRRIGDMVVSTQYVTNLHQVIVNDDREVVCRDTVLFDDDPVTEVF